MRWIVGRSLRYRWLVVFAATATMVFGVAQIPTTRLSEPRNRQNVSATSMGCVSDEW